MNGAVSMRVAVYCRLSEEDSSEHSIERQTRRCQEWAATNNATVVRVYADNGASGTRVARAQFQTMLRELSMLQIRLWWLMTLTDSYGLSENN
jgi:DNA invertase Pin-like site-specific DNA recombinase